MQVFLVKNTKRAAAENFFNCLRPSKEHICLAINPTDLEWVTVRVCYGNSRRWKISTPQGGRKGVAIANRGQSYAGISHYIKMKRGSLLTIFANVRMTTLTYLRSLFATGICVGLRMRLPVSAATSA